MSAEKKIQNIEWFLMIGLAVAIDIINIVLAMIPLVGFLFNKLISIFAWLTFWLWFKLKGAAGIKVRSKSLLAFGGISEVMPVPFLSALPFWTATIVGIMVKNKIKSMPLIGAGLKNKI